MRFAAYAGTSTALAAAVVLRAFHQRPNFYSASVYLAQSQACRMILLNLILLCVYSFVRALQKLFYGPLRPIEREQLWDRSWYAVTETALAMTIFRDEVGAFFMVMFVSLLVGKVWGWISEGRVEVFEQQPPVNPRLFHARLISSLVLSELFDLVMLQYCVQTVVEHPRRPGMMVMFAFEFAILLVTSTSTSARYLLSLQESLIVKKQTKARLEERREEIRAARRQAEQDAQNNVDPNSQDAIANLPREEDVDENDIDVPGWQEKGRWVLLLDLFTDLFKLVIYIMFFTMLLLFHGIPIHIIRDVYMTARSFIKRINDFQKYRNATRDMNARYADATAEELQRDGTCIICREDMQPWQQPVIPDPAPAGGAAAHRLPLDERQRPKKLPCGHILHLGCLKSWLERQQVCPTCRTSVLVNTRTPNPQQNLPPHLQQGAPGVNQGAQLDAGQGGANAPGMGNDNQNQGNGQQPNQHDQNAGGQDNGLLRARTFRIGPWRFTFAAGNPNEIRNILQRADAPARRRNGGAGPGNTGLLDMWRRWRGMQSSGRERGRDALDVGMRAILELQAGLAELERTAVEELNGIRITQAQASTIRALQEELVRLRALQDASQSSNSIQQSLQTPAVASSTSAAPQSNDTTGAVPPRPGTYQSIFTGSTQAQALGPGDPNLPPGLTLPEGYTLMPLQRANYPLAEHASATRQREDLSVADVTPQISSSILTQDSPHGSAPQENNSPAVGNSSRDQASAEPKPHTDALPDWSGVGSETAGSSGLSSHYGTNIDTERSSDISMNGSSREENKDVLSEANGAAQEPNDKGKGKAKQPTVEDATENDDLD